MSEAIGAESNITSFTNGTNLLKAVFEELNSIKLDALFSGAADKQKKAKEVFKPLFPIEDQGPEVDQTQAQQPAQQTPSQIPPESKEEAGKQQGNVEDLIKKLEPVVKKEEGAPSNIPGEK